VPTISFAVSGEQAATSLLILRESGRMAEPTQVQQVSWRVRNNVLERGFGGWTVPTLNGAPGQPARQTASMTDVPGRAAGGLDTPAADGLIWQPILGRVTSIQMQGWVSGQGWVAAESLVGQLQGFRPDAAAAAAAAAAPAAAAVAAPAPTLAPRRAS
jgi:type II secretory pathway component PulJ